MSQQDNLAIVKEIYDAVGRGDVAGVDPGAGVVLRAVDAIRVASDGRDAFEPAEAKCEREREQELGVPSAAWPGCLEPARPAAELNRRARSVMDAASQGSLRLRPPLRNSWPG